MFIIYDLIFLVLAIIYLPIYLFKRKFNPGFLLRLGILPKDLELNRPIWIHAVSVGEVMAVRRLVEELRKSYPQKKLVISTVTPTGNKVARNILTKNDFITYLPLDLSFIVRSVIGKIKPSLFIIAETEIWPNLISSLFRNNIPVALVNCRISDASFRGYLSIKFLLKPLLNKINLFCVQTKTDADRLSRLGAFQNKIKVTGNMKFDTTDYTDKETTDFTDYRRKMGLVSGEKLWVAASTHRGEEEIILEVYKSLLDNFTNIRLLIAPRHPECSAEIINLIKKSGFKAMKISLLNESTNQRINELTVFILNTIGQLISFYEIADIVFVGGSLVKKGGQNILEPAAKGKPILFGPYMFNFRDIADLFLKEQAAILVHNQEELIEKIEFLLNHPAMVDNMAKKSKDLILKNQGATFKNLELIKNLYAAVSL